MRRLSEEEMEQKGFTGQFIIIDQGNGVEMHIIDPDSLPERDKDEATNQESERPLRPPK